MPPTPSRKPDHGAPPWWLVILLLVIAGVAFFWWQYGSHPAVVDTLREIGLVSDEGAPIATVDPAKDAAPPAVPQPGTTLDEVADPFLESPESPESAEELDAALLADQAKLGDVPIHPLPEGITQEGDAGLLALADSDQTILEELSEITDRAQLGRFGNIGDFTRRFVITIDNLPRELVPAQYSAVQRIPGQLVIQRDGTRIVLDPANQSRYDAFTNFAESVGAQNMVAMYMRFYPLLQREYRAMGYPKGHFNDRVIAAIDDMLAAPEIDGPIELEQPKVNYRFVDPALERMSAGRKIMVRVGPRNAARLKQLLREIRGELLR